MPETVAFPRFIEDTPCGKDLFEGLSHQRTAGSIARHIQDHSGNFRLIGLDGGWGGGKSNVISIVNNSLQDSCHFFIYDAWSHQEDLQRRSFLEELTENLTTHKIVDQDKWQQKLKDLLSKRKQTVVKTIPKVSKAFLFVILAGALVPVTSAAAAAIPAGLYYWKIGVAAIPLLFLLISWGVAALRSKGYRSVGKLLLIYKDKDLYRTVDEIISEKEPSIREFRTWMTELGNDAKQQVVIVFDNMDRLQPDQVKRLWSSVHTFFSENHYPRIWVIVPFDRKHVQESFSNNEEKAAHFINKTFSVIFRVAPAVLTDWERFFDLKFRDAFERNEDGELYYARTIFDFYTPEITPRKMIAFINELVSCKMTRTEEAFPLRYMALFIANKVKLLANPLLEIISGEYHEKVKTIFKGDVGLSNHIAALVYDVPLEKAAQVTLYREIQNRLRRKEAIRLNDLAAHPDFVHILHQAVAKEILDVPNTIRSLLELEEELVQHDRSAGLVPTWNLLIGKQMDVTDNGQEFTPYQKVLLMKARDSEMLDSFLGYIVGQVAGRGPGQSFRGGVYFTSLSEIEKEIAANQIPRELASFLRPIQLSPEEFLDYLKASGGDYRRFLAFCQPQELDLHLSRTLPNCLQCGDLLQHLDGEYKFDKFQTALAEFISKEQFAHDLVTPAYNTYRHIGEKRPWKLMLSDATIHKLQSESQGKPSPYLVAMRLTRGSAYVHPFPSTDSKSPSVDDQLTSEVAQCIECFSSLNDLLLLARDWDNKLLRDITKHLVESMPDDSLLAIRSILPHFSQIAQALSVNDEILIGFLGAWYKKDKPPVDSTNLTTMVPDLSLFTLAFFVGNSLCQSIVAAGAEFLHACSEQKWVESLTAPTTYEHRLLQLYLANNRLDSVPRKVMDAYKHLLKGMVARTNALVLPEEFSGLWSLIFEQSKTADIGGTAVAIRDQFIQEATITPKHFLFFESILRKEGRLLKAADDAVRRILIPVSGDNACLERIFGNEVFYIKLIGSAQTDGGDLVSELRKKLEAAPSTSRLSQFLQSFYKKHPHSIKIRSAHYYAAGQAQDKRLEVTAALKRMIEQDANYHQLIENTLFGGDPAPGTPKQLEIIFEHDGKEQTQVWNEREWWKLP